jgi:hypothetical protein
VTGGGKVEEGRQVLGVAEDALLAEQVEHAQHVVLGMASTSER